jgi:hypothetical protein
MNRMDEIRVVKGKDRKFRVIITDPVKGDLFQSVKGYDNRANAVTFAKAFARRHDKSSFGISVTKDVVSRGFTKPYEIVSMSRRDLTG